MIRDLNSSITLIEAIEILFNSFSSLINILIKIKILRLDRIYLYKNISKEKYLR